MPGAARQIQSLGQAYANVLKTCNPDTEAKAREDYLTGKIDLEEFERRLGAINAGS